MKVSEHLIQAAAFEEIRRRAIKDWRYRLIYAVPNGGHRHPIVARKLRAEGVTAGIWDILVDIPISPFPGMRIEVKAGRNTLTPDQTLMGKLYLRAGYALAVCRTSEEILTMITNYLNQKMHQRAA